MATALQIVDRVNKELRGDGTVTAFGSTDIYVQMILTLVNKAKNRILGKRDWSFDRRYGSMLTFLGKQTGVNVNVTNASTSGTFSDVDATIATLAASGRLRMRVASDDVVPNLAIPLSTLTSATGAVTFDHAFPGSTANTAAGSWELVQYEQPLPSTVKRITAAYYEEQPIGLCFVDDNISDPFPAAHLNCGQPAMLAVGGTLTTTNVDAGETTTGIRVALYPPPDSQYTITYDSIYEHADFTATTDTLTGVPEAIVGLIVDQATLFALQSRVKDDPDAARLLDVRLRADMKVLEDRDSAQPSRRRVPRPVGSGYRRGNPWTRWANRTVPSP